MMIEQEKRKHMAIKTYELIATLDWKRCSRERFWIWDMRFPEWKMER